MDTTHKGHLDVTDIQRMLGILEHDSDRTYAS